jgi:NADH-quinone oxidoreductase subunit H
MVVVGLLVSWVDRKVTARVQYRVGPPLLQPVWDFLKLLGKETVVPRGASRLAFFGAPLIGLAGVLFVGLIVGMAVFFKQGFYGDLIVALYLLVLPSLAVILGGAASKNPLASVGASREMKLVLGYELPFILILLVAVVKAGGTLKMTALLAQQAETGAFAASLSGVIALVVAIFCIQAKMALVPFDQAEAETELTGGALIEYSGPALAVYKLTKMLMFYAVPMFVVAVLWGGFGNSVGGFLLGIVKYLVLVVLITLMRNTNPRVRIEHAVKFFWVWVAVPALAAVALAVMGL